MPRKIEKNKPFTPEEDLLAFTMTELNNYKRKREREKENSFYMQIMKHFTNKHGGFTFLTTQENILQAMNPATVGRLAYLATYLERDTQLLLYQDRPMLKCDLQEVLKLSRPTTNKFYSECISAEVLKDHGKEGLYLDSNLFFKGKTTNKECTKLFRVTVQQLYEKLPQSRHNLFGYIIQLVPLINFEWNVVCENPEETDRQLIQPLSFKGVCEKLGYDYENHDRLKKALTKPIFIWEHRKQPLCAFISVNTDVGRQNTMVVNPHILFAGSCINNVGVLDIAFTPHKATGKNKKG